MRDARHPINKCCVNLKCGIRAELRPAAKYCHMSRLAVPRRGTRTRQ
jgi:hypothetical protein